MNYKFIYPQGSVWYPHLSNLPSILVGTTDSSVHVLGSCGSVSFTPDSITSPLPNDTHHILLSPHLNHYDSFLLSSSTKYYAVITNTSVASEHLNITGLGVVTNGTQCDPTVCFFFFLHTSDHRATIIVMIFVHVMKCTKYECKLTWMPACWNHTFPHNCRALHGILQTQSLFPAM